MPIRSRSNITPRLIGRSARVPRILGTVAAFALVMSAGVLFGSGTASAAVASPLGSASNFAVLAGAAATVPNSTVFGDVGGAAAVTVSNSQVHGTVHASGDTATGEALADLSAAYTNLKSLAPTGDLPGEDLGGYTITPGVYYSTAALAATGTVTFDAGGRTNATFVIQSDGALNTSDATAMVLLNSAKADNIYWVTTGGVNLGDSSTFYGNVIANAAVTIGGSSTVVGRASSVTAAVTLDEAITITKPTSR